MMTIVMFINNNCLYFISIQLQFNSANLFLFDWVLRLISHLFFFLIIDTIHVKTH